MSISKIQAGDQVKVIAGNHKGLVGQVVKILKTKIDGKQPKIRASVSVVPKIAKYRKANKAYGMPGQMTTVDRTIDISNLSLLTKDGVLSKVSISEDKNGKKQRVLKKSNQIVVRNKVSKVDLSKDLPKDENQSKE